MLPDVPSRQVGYHQQLCIDQASYVNMMRVVVVVVVVEVVVIEVVVVVEVVVMMRRRFLCYLGDLRCTGRSVFPATCPVMSSVKGVKETGAI